MNNVKQPSTRSLHDIPPIGELIRLSQSLALLDAILSPVDLLSPYIVPFYAFDSKCGPGEMVASMCNGCGDEYYIYFNDYGAAIKGFAHESEMSPWATDPPAILPGMYDDVPVEFSSFLKEPRFSMSDVTFCIWRRYGDAVWHRGEVAFPDNDDGDPDGSEYLFEMFDGEPLTYQRFASEYFGKEVPLEAIEHIYHHRPLTTAIVQALNSELRVEDLNTDILKIGYPDSAT